MNPTVRNSRCSVKTLKSRPVWFRSSVRSGFWPFCAPVGQRFGNDRFRKLLPRLLIQSLLAFPCCGKSLLESVGGQTLAETLLVGLFGDMLAGITSDIHQLALNRSDGSFIPIETLRVTMRFFISVVRPNSPGTQSARSHNRPHMGAWLVLLATSLSMLIGSQVLAQGKKQVDTPPPKTPVLAEASEEGQQAIGGFKYPKPLEAKLFAAEPMVGNPVALHVDFKGRLFVAESYRQGKGIEDNRNHSDWLDEDLAAQTVQDRIDYIRKHIPDADTRYTEFDDRIRLLKDTDRDGVADSTTVFANQFNRIEMGTGAGVLSYR